MFYRNYVHRSNMYSASILAFLAGALTWAILGKKIKDGLEKNPRYRELKEQINERVSQMSDLTREKYDQVVDEVSEKYSRVKGISNNELKDLTDDLKGHWVKIKNAWNKGGDIE